MRRRSALSIVERGWRGARECSIALDRADIDVVHLIKGRLSAGVRALIAPYPHVRLVSVPRDWFRPALWLWLLTHAVAGRPSWLLVDQERTRRELAPFCRLLAIRIVMIHEDHNGYHLQLDGNRRPFHDVFGITPG